MYCWSLVGKFCLLFLDPLQCDRSSSGRREIYFQCWNLWKIFYSVWRLSLIGFHWLQPDILFSTECCVRFDVVDVYSLWVSAHFIELLQLETTCCGQGWYLSSGLTRNRKTVVSLLCGKRFVWFLRFPPSCRRRNKLSDSLFMISVVVFLHLDSFLGLIALIFKKCVYLIQILSTVASGTWISWIREWQMPLLLSLIIDLRGPRVFIRVSYVVWMLKESRIYLSVDSLSPNFRFIWWSNIRRSEGKKMPVIVALNSCWLVICISGG